MKRITLVAIFCLALCSCDKKFTGENMVDKKNLITVKINQPGADFKNHYPGIVRVERQPAGITFYQINWKANAKGIVKLDMNDSSFAFDRVLGLIGSENNEEENLGIYQIVITSSITDADKISHEDARKEFFSILKQIKNSGWSPIIPFTAPRLRGRDMLNYLLESGNPTTLDADYELNIDEWMKIENLTSWEFEKGKVFLDVSFVRSAAELEDQKSMTYIVRYSIKSDVAYFKEFIDPGATDPWKLLLPGELKNSAERRRHLENSLEKTGIKIDKTYTNPKPPIVSGDD